MDGAGVGPLPPRQARTEERKPHTAPYERDDPRSPERPGASPNGGPQPRTAIYRSVNYSRSHRASPPRLALRRLRSALRLAKRHGTPTNPRCRPSLSSATRDPHHASDLHADAALVPRARPRSQPHAKSTSPLSRPRIRAPCGRPAVGPQRSE